MLKQLIFFLLLFIAAVCTSCVIRPEMTREQYREQEENYRQCADYPRADEGFSCCLPSNQAGENVRNAFWF